MTEVPPPAKTYRTSSRRIYPRVVYARVTEQEWSIIQRRASLAGLSMSRYLVEAGLREKPPMTSVERAQLQLLLHKFRRAFISINQLACDHLVVTLGGKDIRQLLEETASLMEQLAQELSQRVYEATPGETIAVSDEEP